MNNDFEKEKSVDYSQRFCGSIYDEQTAVKLAPHKRIGLKKFLLTIVFLSLLVVVPVYAFKDNTITHATETIVEIEKDGYTHRILYAFIQNNRIYFEVFCYKTDQGITLERQYTPPSVNPYTSQVDYWVYYNGKRLGSYSRGYGSTVNASYEMPTVKKGKTVTVSLYTGNTFISAIELYPANLPVFTERPRATVDDITLIADARMTGEQLQVIISADLPKNAAPNQYFYFRGFIAHDIYVQDAAGNIYKDKTKEFYDESTYSYTAPDDIALRRVSEKLYLHMLYNIFYFDIPKDAGDLKIIIPQITYTSKRHMPIERYGSWEIAL